MHPPTHTHSLSRTHTHTHSLSLSLSHCLIHIHPHTLSHTRSLTLLPVLSRWWSGVIAQWSMLYCRGTVFLSSCRSCGAMLGAERRGRGEAVTSNTGRHPAPYPLIDNSKPVPLRDFTGTLFGCTLCLQGFNQECIYTYVYTPLSRPPQRDTLP